MTKILKNILYMARRFKLATAFNFTGLIVALAAFFLMMTQVAYQATYNHGVEDSELLYRIDTDYMNNHGLFSDEVFYPIVKVLDKMPEVETYSLMNRIQDDPVYADYYKQPVLTKNGDTVRYTHEYYCNETAVSALAGKNRVLSGSIDWSDDKGDPYPNRNPRLKGIIIPESIAREYFGKVDVVGDSLMAIDMANDTTLAWSIRGVYKDFPKNSELRNCIYELMRDQEKEYFKYNLNNTFKCFIKFKTKPHDVESLGDSLKQGLIELIEREGWEKYADFQGLSVPSLKTFINKMHIRLCPIRESYFTSKTLSQVKNGFKPMFIIMGLSCLLLIVLAAIHFLNFMLVESPMRIRGINTRLVLGASRGSLRQGIVAECVVTSVIAGIIALMLCGALSFSPVVNQLIDGSIAPHQHWALALCTLAVAGAIGIVAGWYPATFATSFTPALALKGNFGLTRQGHQLRKAIIGFQLFISFLMVIYMAILIHESLYIFNSDYGYDKSNVSSSSLPLSTSDKVKQLIHDELAAIPGVKGVSYSDASLGLSDAHGAQPLEFQGQGLTYDYSYVDCDYMRDMGIEVIEGRHFTPHDSAAIIFNKAAQQRLSGLTLGSKIPRTVGDDSLTVIGFCENIRYNTTRFHSDQPFAFIVESSGGLYYLSSVNINIDATAGQETLDKANQILRNHLDREAKPFITFDASLRDSYQSEFRYFGWIFIISLVCTFITLIGVLCLIMFETQYRRKEIGLRKVAGAKTGEIIKMLCFQYIPLIFISFAAAAPIAHIGGKETLDYFAEHASISWWIYPLALVIVGAIITAALMLPSWQAARENPANSIKSE